MVSFPNCKINLGLQIIAKRPDGYHDIQTVFYPIQVVDVLEIIPAEVFTMSLSGLAVAGNPGDNLCARAYRLLKEDFPELPPLHIFLHKAIPAGAGLGGGSADGAFTLMAINEQFRLRLSSDRLAAYALQLGSDCPFFIQNTPCMAYGRGENLQVTKLDLSGYSLLVVHPGIHVNTGWAFSQVKISEKVQPLADIIEQPVSFWKDALRNDFEDPVFVAYPQIKTIKETLYHAGARYASMSGSGSAVYGIFEKNNIPSLSFEKNYQQFVLK